MTAKIISFPDVIGPKASAQPPEPAVGLRISLAESYVNLMDCLVPLGEFFCAIYAAHNTDNNELLGKPPRRETGLSNIANEILSASLEILHLQETYRPKNAQAHDVVRLILTTAVVDGYVKDCLEDSLLNPERKFQIKKKFTAATEPKSFFDLPPDYKRCLSSDLSTELGDYEEALEKRILRIITKPLTPLIKNMVARAKEVTAQNKNMPQPQLV